LNSTQNNASGGGVTAPGMPGTIITIKQESLSNVENLVGSYVDSTTFLPSPNSQIVTATMVQNNALTNETGSANEGNANCVCVMLVQVVCVTKALTFLQLQAQILCNKPKLYSQKTIAHAIQINGVNIRSVHRHIKNQTNNQTNTNLPSFLIIVFYD